MKKIISAAKGIFEIFEILFGFVESLIENNQLGYMAALRNLRNIINANPKNIDKIYNKLFSYYISYYISYLFYYIYFLFN